MYIQFSSSESHPWIYDDDAVGSFSTFSNFFGGYIYVLYNNDMMEMLQKFDISVVKSSKRQSQCCGRLYTTDAEIKQGGGTLC